MKGSDLGIYSSENLSLGKDNLPSGDLIEKLGEVFKVFGDPTRIKILFALKDNELCVGDLADLLDMTQSSVSHQLRTLRDAKLVKGRRKGKFVMYSLDDDHVHDIIQIALDHVCHD